MTMTKIMVQDYLLLEGNMTQNYVLQSMSGERAKKILEDLLIELSGIDTDDMTTFELNLLRRIAANPPTGLHSRDKDRS